MIPHPLARPVDEPDPLGSRPPTPPSIACLRDATAPGRTVFHALGDGLREPLLLVTVEGEVVDANPAFEELAAEHRVGASHGLAALHVPSAGGTSVEAYLDECGRALLPVPGWLDLRRGDGSVTTFRARGWLARPAEASAPALVFLALSAPEPLRSGGPLLRHRAG